MAPAAWIMGVHEFMLYGCVILGVHELKNTKKKEWEIRNAEKI